MTSILFVCLGNICRSPTAHAIMQHKVDQAGLSQTFRIDSAGTGAYHIGKAPDPRSISAGAQYGYDLTPLRARQLTSEDLQTFDYVLAMDAQNLAYIRNLAAPHTMPSTKAHLGLLLDFAGAGQHGEVPDPYYGGDAGFATVIDLCEQACDGLLARVMAQ